MRKKLKYQYCICLIIIGIILSFKVVNKRWPIDYYLRMAKGEFETSFLITKSANHEKGKYTVCVKDRYYIYDIKSGKIYDMETKEDIIGLYTRLDSISSNGKYIYCEIPGFLCQYAVDGTLIGKCPLDESNVYVGTENVYCLDGSTCKILSAENIEKAGNGIRETDMIYDVSGVSIINKNIKYETEECFISVQNNEGEACIEKNEHAVIIFGEDIDVIEKDNNICAGKDQIDSLCVHKGYLYAAGFEQENDYIYVIGQNGGWEVVKDSPKYNYHKLQYSRGVQEPGYLILLAENYFIRGIGSFGNEINGSIGDYGQANLCYIDLNKNQAIYSYNFTDEIVLSMGIERFTTIKDGIVYIYDTITGEKIGGEIVEGYETKKSYQVEVCGERIFFFREGELLDWIEIR